jgi:hypothetical protein
VNKNSPTTSLSHFERRASRQVQPSDRRDAVATIVIGFTWGGWVFGTTFEAKSAQRVNEALVRGYALVCIDRFKQQANVEQKWTELAKVQAYRRDTYIQETGFATPPGSTSPNPAIADACADALSKVIAMQSPNHER